MPGQSCYNFGMPSYTLQRISEAPPAFVWDSLPWSELPSLSVDAFRPEGSDHRPDTRARFCHDGHNLFGLFSVQDRYVRSVHTQFQSRTHRDSCVEVFLHPKPALGYFSFEFNAGGAYAALYISDHTRTADLFKAYTRLTPEDVRGVRVYPSLPAVIEPEIAGPTHWTLGLQIPVAALGPYVGDIGPLSGQSWRANVYKCADETSHPHWAAWSPVSQLNFHLPECFGEFVFA